MKKWIALLLAILCVIGFASCKDESSKEKKKTSAKEEKTEDMTDTRLYSFLHEGVSVIPGDDAKASLAALTHLQLGESAQGSCLGGVDGEDVVYVYNGFYIGTFRTSSEEEIRWVVFTDDSVSTRQGIKVGATADEVKAAYGMCSTETESLLTYRCDRTELRFELRDGAVIGIAYTVAE